jgi:chromosome segregation ATPase
VTTARSWWRRGDDHRAGAQAAKEAAAEAFYELDTAQRDLTISIETITAVDRSPAGRKAAADFQALGRRIDQVSAAYIAAVDAHDVDAVDLDLAAATRARNAFTLAKDEIGKVRADLERFAQSLGPTLTRAENELVRLAPAVARAKQSLLAATEALDTVRATGLKADDLAARLAGLAPELTKLNQGASAHGVQETIRRADDVRRRAEEIRAEAERLPERAAEIDRRLVSLRTRTQALTTRAAQVAPTLSELRRRFSAACWQDLQQVPEQAATAAAQAERRLREAQSARDEQRWTQATEGLSAVRELRNGTDAAWAAARDRLRKLNEVARDPQGEIERTRFAIRDAQRLAMQGRATPEPKHARPLDDAVHRLDAAVAGLTGRHPDYWAFLLETAAIRQLAERVVANIREERALPR